MRYKDRVGEKYTTKSYGTVEIIAYNNSNDCTIKFEDGTILTKVIFSRIKLGTVKNPNFKQVYGVGCIGLGIYSNSNKRKAYITWVNMLDRAYSKKYPLKHPTYIGVTVCEEWLNFQNFVPWFDANYIEGWHLDKDLICKECKIYSPETCCYLPPDINKLLSYMPKDRRGVLKYEANKGYYVKISLYSKQTYLGTYATEVEAMNVYNSAKLAHIIELANKYKGELNKNIYNKIIKDYSV